MSTLRLVVVLWWLQLKMRSRSSFDGILAIVYPLFFATTIFFMYRQNGDQAALVSAAVGASLMGVWSAVSTSASTTLQGERRQGTLELLVAAPTPFSLVILPATVSFSVAPAAGAVLTVDYAPAFLARFADDGEDLEQIMQDFWTLKRLKIETVRA